jgi:hypothetical protein
MLCLWVPSSSVPSFLSSQIYGRAAQKVYSVLIVNCVVFRLPAPWAAGCTRCGTAPPETVCWTPPFRQPTASSTGRLTRSLGNLRRLRQVGLHYMLSRQPTVSSTGIMSKATLPKATYSVLDRKVIFSPCNLRRLRQVNMSKITPIHSLLC